MDTSAPAPDDEELPGIVAELISRSRSASVEDRRAAVDQLYELAYKAGPKIAIAIPVLMEAMADPDPKIGESALWALCYCMPDSIEPLTECLAHHQPLVRERAAHSLGNIGVDAKAALPALRALLADDDQAVRRRAAWAIGLIRDTHPDAIGLLFRNVSHGATEDKAAALHALGNIGQALEEPRLLRAHQPLIMKALGHESGDVRWSALYVVEALKLEPQTHADLLMDLIRHDQSARVLEAALSQLKKLATMTEIGELVPALTALLSDPGRGAGLACEVLASMRPAPLQAIDALRLALEVDELVLPAAGALWKITADAGPLLPALERIFDDYGESVCDLIWELGSAAAPLLPRLIDALAEESWDLQWAAADALGAVASPEPRVVEALVDALGHPSPIVRSAAARALAKTGTESVPRLRDLLVAEPQERGAWAAYALGAMGAQGNAALPELRRGMRGGMEPLAGCCAIAVALIGADAAAVPYLEAILQSDEPAAPRRAAAAALGQLGPAALGSTAVLEALLGDDDFEVHQAAEDALAIIQRPQH